MSRRLVVFVLLLAVLCSCCAGSGLLSRRPPAFRHVDLQAPSLDQLRRRLTIKLKGADLVLKSGQGCAVQGETLLVPPEAVCIFAIPASDRFTRQLVLVLDAPASSAALTMVQPKAVSVDKTLAPGEEPYALDIYRNPDKVEALLTIRDCRLPQPEGDGATALPGACVLEIRR